MVSFWSCVKVLLLMLAEVWSRWLVVFPDFVKNNGNVMRVSKCHLVVKQGLWVGFLDSNDIETHRPILVFTVVLSLKI